MNAGDWSKRWDALAGDVPLEGPEHDPPGVGLHSPIQLPHPWDERKRCAACGSVVPGPVGGETHYRLVLTLELASQWGDTRSSSVVASHTPL